jgi:hypothetical protein
MTASSPPPALNRLVILLPSFKLSFISLFRVLYDCLQHRFASWFKPPQCCQYNRLIHGRSLCKKNPANKESIYEGVFLFIINTLPLKYFPFRYKIYVKYSRYTRYPANPYVLLLLSDEIYMKHFYYFTIINKKNN